MTDVSESLETPADPSAVSASTTAVLARGHLHPAVLLLRLLSALRQSAFTLVLGIVVDRWFLVLALTLFALQLGVSIVRYLTLEYTLTDDVKYIEPKKRVY